MESFTLNYCDSLGILRAYHLTSQAVVCGGWSLSIMTTKNKNNNPSDEKGGPDAAQEHGTTKPQTSPPLRAALDAVEHMNNLRDN
jgi:hypothetical protein